MSSWTCLHTYTALCKETHGPWQNRKDTDTRAGQTRFYLFWYEVRMGHAFHDYMIEITSIAYLWNSWCGSINPVNIPPTAEHQSMFHYLKDPGQAYFVTRSFKGKPLKYSSVYSFHVSHISFYCPVAVLLSILPRRTDFKTVLLLYCPQGYLVKTISFLIWNCNGHKSCLEKC